MTIPVEQRVTSLENRMDEQERLRASQDRDLSDIAEGVRAQDRMLKALAKTQSEHTAKLDGIDRELGAQRNILQALAISELEHTEKLARLDRQMRQMDGGVQKIVGMLDTLIEREDGR